MAVAVSVVMPTVPVKLRFSVPVAAFTKVPPTPASAELTVNVPLLFSVTPVTVTFGIEKVPDNVWEAVVSKV